MTPDEDRDVFFDAIRHAIEYPSEPFEFSAADFNAIAAHVSVLLGDAVSAFERQSFGTAVFLAITALEETAKAEMLIYRRDGDEDAQKPRRDPLLDHKTKHRIAVRPTTFMGRLPELLGADAVARLRALPATGELRTLRERALYARFDGGKVQTPRDAVGHAKAREIVLLALECADDILAGYSEASHALGQRFEAWMDAIAASKVTNG